MESVHIAITYTSITTSACTCPCGRRFVCDSLTEENLLFDEKYNLLRAICQTCGKMEHAIFGRFGTQPPHRNRIKEFLR